MSRVRPSAGPPARSRNDGPLTESAATTVPSPCGQGRRRRSAPPRAPPSSARSRGGGSRRAGGRALRRGRGSWGGSRRSSGWARSRARVVVRMWPAAPSRSRCSAAASVGPPSSRSRSNGYPRPGRRRRPRRRTGRPTLHGLARTLSEVLEMGRAPCAPGRAAPSPRRRARIRPNPSRYFSVDGSRSSRPRSASVATSREAVALCTPRRRPSSVTPQLAGLGDQLEGSQRAADRLQVRTRLVSHTATPRRPQRGVGGAEPRRYGLPRCAPRTLACRVTPHALPCAEDRCGTGARPSRSRSYEVVIVGAGGHGLATAYYLADEPRHHRRLRGREGLARRRQHGPQHHDHPLELPLGRVGRDLRALAEAVGGARGGTRVRHPVHPARRPEPGARPGRRPQRRCAACTPTPERGRRRVARRRPGEGVRARS